MDWTDYAAHVQAGCLNSLSFNCDVVHPAVLAAPLITADDTPGGSSLRYGLRARADIIYRQFFKHLCVCQLYM